MNEVTGPGYRLILGDCLDVMPRLEAVDGVVTDPPFGIDFKYSMHDDSPADYEAMMVKVVSETTRINRGMSVFWQGMLNADKWHRWFPLGFRIFAACKGFVQFRPTDIQFSWDPVIFWGSRGLEPSVYRKDWNVQSLAPFGAGRERIEHPCPRPLEQVRYVIQAFTAPGDIILDPFAGSGTTGVACLQTGRRFIGIEIDPAYHAIAARRLADAAAQPMLIPSVESEPVPVQAGLHMEVR